MLRAALIGLAGAALVGLLVIGLLQAGDSESAGARAQAPEPLSLEQVSHPVPGAPAELAALRRQVNVLVDGGQKALDERLRELRGHPVVVNLWASWCAPCRYELPVFQRQANRRGAEVAFLGVNVGDNAGDARRLARRYPMPYPSIEDPRQQVRAEYGAVGLPATAFYDAEGELVQLHQGPFWDERQLSEAIERYARP